MKKLLLIISFVFVACFAQAQTEKIDSLKAVIKAAKLAERAEREKLGNVDSKIKIRFDSRIDGMYNAFSDKENYPENKNNAGFYGRYLKLLVDGKISDKFSYSMRYRMYTAHDKPSEFFYGIDWLNVKYSACKNFNMTLGKVVVAIGGWEYDAAPVDVHFASDFWNHINPFSLGINAAVVSNNQNHTVEFQFANSPFSTKVFDTMFTYGVRWFGNMNWFKTIYSVNFMEYERGKFVNYIALGNKAVFGNFSAYLDYMNRAGSTKNFFKDFSIISKVQYDFCDRWSVFAKGGYDQNNAQAPNIAPDMTYDTTVLPGVERGFYGLGVEYFPIKNRRHNLRFHAFWYGETIDPTVNHINLGVKWQMMILDR